MDVGDVEMLEATTLFSIHRIRWARCLACSHMLTYART